MLVKKKDSGNAARLVMLIVSAMAILVLLMAFLTSVDIIYKKYPISQLSRKYILKMETVGYLTEADRVLLVDELKNLDILNISLSGTTLAPAEYGSPIKLCIAGKLHYKSTKTIGLFNVIYEGEMADIYEERVSTAKN